MKKFVVVLCMLICTVFVAPGLALSADPAGQAAVVNINTASALELQSLPGIGEVTARSIVEYRSQQGNFKTPEDLTKVKGIGEKTFDKIRDRIAVK